MYHLGPKGNSSGWKSNGQREVSDWKAKRERPDYKIDTEL